MRLEEKELGEGRRFSDFLPVPSTKVRKISVVLIHFKNHDEDSAETEQCAGLEIARCDRYRGLGDAEALEALQEEAQGSFVEYEHGSVERERAN